MNKLIIALVFSLSLIAGPACKSDKKDKDKDLAGVEVPAAVKSAFSAKFSTVTDIIWEDAHENGQHSYKAKFTIDGKKMKAEFAADGSLIKEKEND